MKLRGRLGKILNPALLGRLAFMLFSIALVGGYFIVSYQYYFKTYQTTQNQEIETAHQKMDGALKLLKELLGLSESLISTTISKASLKIPRLNQEDRLREILNNVSLLKPSSDLPSLQKVAFYKFSPPQMIVTRFGTLPFVSSKIPVEKLMSHRWDSELMLEEKAIVGRVTVGKPKSTLEGVLEIQVNLAEFKRFLGFYQTIRFDEPLKAGFIIDQNHLPFHLGKINPLSFRAYVLTQAVNQRAKMTP
jgi:hypothetical protein